MDMDNPDSNEETGGDHQLVEAFLGDDESEDEGELQWDDNALADSYDMSLAAAHVLEYESGSNSTLEGDFDSSSATSELDEEESEQAALEEDFDISLPASQSYMSSAGNELFHVVRRSMLEAGARVRMPCLAHRGIVFPGETVPLVVPNVEDAATLSRIVAEDGLFTLLSPNPNGNKTSLSGYGVVCEVYQAAHAAESPLPAGDGLTPARAGRCSARALARALHRCKLVAAPDAPESEQDGGRARLPWFYRLHSREVEVLPELVPRTPLHAVRLACLDQRRPQSSKPERWVRNMDALVTPWPLFLYDFFDVERMRETIKDYFSNLAPVSLLPDQPVELSFFVARNMWLSDRDQSALFTVDDAILRLHMECSLISKTAVVCCGACRVALAQRAHVMCMSSSGVQGTFANPHGHMHDVVTTRRAAHVRLQGAPSADFSWFPGYTWTVLSCARCLHHVGWRFDAISATLRPRRFYGLCRNYETAPSHDDNDDVAPSHDDDYDDDAQP